MREDQGAVSVCSGWTAALCLAVGITVEQGRTAVVCACVNCDQEVNRLGKVEMGSGEKEKRKGS